jgi:prevent-host-death family protein
MPEKVNIHEAKTHFSRLLAQVRKGEEIIISKSGKPVARLVPFEEKPVRRVPGSAKGGVIIFKDFDAPLPEPILKSFEQQ